ncbi:MAG: hypothetical protein Ct9H300mP28_06220 [Pseudomonadota bacterium]|nr:MAG: hypothetical protein Ct9H300mP28_06220 [Pseudomonadota bacterium]
MSKKFADKIYDRIYIRGLLTVICARNLNGTRKVLRQKLAGKPLPEAERFRESVIRVSIW